MKRLKYFLVIFVSVLCIKPAVSGDLRVDTFSWSFGPNGIVVNSAVASPILPGPLCWDGEKCGIAVGVLITPPTGPEDVLYIMQSYGKPPNFTVDNAVSVINGLTGKTISGTAGLNTPGYKVEACVWTYNKGKGFESYSKILEGVCGGGYIPPVPVPTNCDLSMDNSVMDFGDISSTAFLNAGAGGKPSGISVQQRTLNVSCSSPQSAQAKLRMTTDKASGNMLVSSNQDVGFLLSAGENDPTVKPLTPNLSSSSYPVNLDNQGKTSIAIKAVPVSVTGKKPAAGTFTSNALLDISWD